MLRHITVLLLGFSIVITGCSKSSPSAAQQNHDLKSIGRSGSLKTAQLRKTNTTSFPLPQVDQQKASLLASKVLGKTEGWFLYKVKSNGTENLVSYHSTDAGKSWTAAALPFPEQSWEKSYFGKVIVSFHAESSSVPDWILVTSDPSAGLMNKNLYRSVDNGKTWSLVRKIDQTIDGYATGIAFRDKLNGWITASQHGTALVPLYRTKDGGKTWSLQQIDIPKDFKYGNVTSPVFDDNDPLNGSIKIEFVGDARNETLTYVTTDGGEIWRPSK